MSSTSHKVGGQAPAAPGERVTLVRMGNDPYPLPPGAQGTVTGVTRWLDGSWNIGVRWDSGRTLGLVYPEDRFVVERG